MGINKDQVEGRVKEGTGKVEEIAGRVAGSPTREMKGKLKKTVGAVQAGYGDAKEREEAHEKERDKEAEREAKQNRP